MRRCFGRLSIDVFPMPHAVQNDIRSLDVVADPIGPGFKPPLTDALAFEFLHLDLAGFEELLHKHLGAVVLPARLPARIAPLSVTSSTVSQRFSERRILVSSRSSWRGRRGSPSASRRAWSA